MPPVAPMRIGISDSVSSGSTSKNDLNSPLNEALNAGVTAMTPSASATVPNASSSGGEGNPLNIASMIACPRGGVRRTTTRP